MNIEKLTIGPFVTHVYENGVLLRTSRAMRKEVRSIFQGKKSTLTYFVALFFVIGSACFIIASIMSLAAVFSIFIINTIYFIGSIFCMVRNL
ncbi:hypothetical protein [Sulfurimonas sp.]|uniref:hypothetical protein n=1 Tax=Sulfurimonas sp. TaxID=2022749 RepID=UPI0025ECA50B|nr:hypothetical protein [Sulfurimonas sp.]